MQTRREQVRAYRFINRRMVSALIAGDPESTDLPMRRLGLSIFGSTMLAAIVFAIVAIYGLYNPGGGTLNANALVIERETGARFVYVNGRLYPVLNFTSARLILDQPNPEQQTVSQNTLRDIPRGRALGIPGAPDSVPAASALLKLPWSICGAPTVSGRTTNLSIGRELPGGTTVGEGALLLESGTSRYLIWHNHRLRIPSAGVLAALEMAFASPVPVGNAVLNSITAGPELRAPTIDGDNTDSGRTINGHKAKIGEVFRAGNESYVLLKDGLAPINPVTARLILAGGEKPFDVSPNEAGALRSQTKVEPPGALNVLPALHQLDPTRATICATYRGEAPEDELGTTVEFFQQTPPGLVATDPDLAGLTTRAVRTVDRVLVDGGHGALVRSQPSPGSQADGTTIYLITDEGIRYALGDDAQAALGFAGVTPVLIPASLLVLVPPGPGLNRAAAMSYSGITPAPTPSPSPSPSGSASSSSSASRSPSASASASTSTSKSASAPT